MGAAAPRGRRAAPLRPRLAARRRAGRHHGRGLPRAAGHGLRRGRRAAGDRRALGDRRRPARLRAARLVAPALGRAGVDDGADDRGRRRRRSRPGTAWRYAGWRQRCSRSSSGSSASRAASARLGLLAELLSKPVLVGYLAGIAVLMIVSQLGKVTGVPVEGDDVRRRCRRPSATSTTCTRRRCSWRSAVLALLFAFQRGRFPRARSADRDAGSPPSRGRSTSSTGPGCTSSATSRRDCRPSDGCPTSGVDLSALLRAGARRDDRRLRRQRAHRPRVRDPQRRAGSTPTRSCWRSGSPTWRSAAPRASR